MEKGRVVRMMITAWYSIMVLVFSCGCATAPLPEPPPECSDSILYQVSQETGLPLETVSGIFQISTLELIDQGVVTKQETSNSFSAT